MPKIIKANAWCNNEVAYLAWKTDGKIEDCLGFMITRIHLETGERRMLPTWVAFDTQSNPDWVAQDTSVWPVQKYSWRDLTLRRSRDTLNVRPELTVKYEIVAVDESARGAKPCQPPPRPNQALYGVPDPALHLQQTRHDKRGDRDHHLRRHLGGVHERILSTQNLRQQLETSRGKTPSLAQLKRRIETEQDKLREFLAVTCWTSALDLRASQGRDGKLFMALYELADPELIALLLKNQARLHLILSTAGQDP